MSDELLKEPFILFIIALSCVIFWYWLHWLLVSSAVKRGVKNANKDIANLLKKSLELKGVSREEIDKICGVQFEEFFDSETQTMRKRDKDGNVVD